MTSDGREFHVRDAAAGKARSPIVRRHVEGQMTVLFKSVELYMYERCNVPMVFHNVMATV